MEFSKANEDVVMLTLGQVPASQHAVSVQRTWTRMPSRASASIVVVLTTADMGNVKVDAAGLGSMI